MIRSPLSTRAGICLLGLLVGLGCNHEPSGPDVSLQVSPAAPTILTGMTLQLDALPVSGIATPQSIEWSSSAPTIVDVDATGRLTAKAVGSATIRATASSGIGETVVTVAESGGSIRTKYKTTCGVTAGGDLYCWGQNDVGQAVPGNAVATLLSPTKIASLSAVTSVSPAALHSCATTASASFCWGCNRHGELGNGVTAGTTDGCTLRSAPVAVVGGQTFVRIEASGSDVTPENATCSDAYCGASSCGIVSSGQVYCWGAGIFTPAALNTSVRFTSMSMGLPTGCGVGTDKNIYCWALPTGNGAAINPLSVVTVAAPETFQTVSVGRTHNCAIDKRGAAWCLGTNAAGELGAPASETCIRRFTVGYPCRSQPDTIVGGYRFQSISAGGGFAGTTGYIPMSHTCGVAVSQEIFCWGSNAAGQLGNGSQTNSQSPVKISSALKFKSVTTGALHTCAVSVDGAAYCWGDNSAGQLGNGTTVNSSVPVPVTGGLIFR